MGNSPNMHSLSNILGMVWVIQRQNSGFWSKPSILTVFSDVLEEGWWNAVTHNSRKFVVGQTA